MQKFFKTTLCVLTSSPEYIGVFGMEHRDEEPSHSLHLLQYNLSHINDFLLENILLSSIEKKNQILRILSQRVAFFEANSRYLQLLVNVVQNYQL